VGADRQVRGLRAAGRDHHLRCAKVHRWRHFVPIWWPAGAAAVAAVRRAPRAARCMCAAVGAARRAERRRRGVGGGSGAAGEETELDQSVRAFARSHPLCIYSWDNRPADNLTRIYQSYKFKIKYNVLGNQPAGGCCSFNWDMCSAKLISSSLKKCVFAFRNLFLDSIVIDRRTNQFIIYWIRKLSLQNFIKIPNAKINYVANF